MGDSFNFASPEGHAEALIAPVSRNVLDEIASMKGALGRFASAVDFANLESNAVAALTRIERLIIEGRIEPLAKIRATRSGCGRPANVRRCGPSRSGLE